MADFQFCVLAFALDDSPHSIRIEGFFLSQYDGAAMRSRILSEIG
jgi:hypothetical protein